MDWITTANGLIALITALVGLIGTGVGAFVSIKAFIKAAKEKSAQELWSMITIAADAAMKTAEKSGKKGAAKKQMVIDMVKASLAANGLEIGAFIDQLSAYIDDCIKFANSLNDKK